MNSLDELKKEIEELKKGLKSAQEMLESSPNPDEVLTKKTSGKISKKDKK